MLDWLANHIYEVIGVITGLIYIGLEVKENIWLWPVGIVTSTFFIIVYFQSKLYADMGLQVYYLGISIYGWVYWTIGKRQSGVTNDLPISRLSKSLISRLILISLVLFVLIRYILITFTDSDVAGWDALTTALSIVATWMLTHKYIEQWWIWIVVNLISLLLYIHKELYLTAFLFLVYGLMAILGYMEWNKKMKIQDEAIG